MKPLIVRAMLAIGVSILFLSCTFDNEEEFFDTQFCNTQGMTYDSVIHVFEGVCLSCHSDDLTYRPGIQFDTYELTKASVETGKVIPAIKHIGPYKMPNELPKLPDCDIARIEAWIEQGMPK